MKRILVPLDGSAFAEQAIETARGLAHRTGAGIEFVAVVPPALPASRVSGAPPLEPRLDNELRQNLRAYLARIESAERARSTFEVAGVVREGGVAGEIVEQAVEGDADVVVMATHGRGGAGRALLGSVADRVIRSSGRPVLLVRHRTEGAAGAVPLRKVVVAVAGTDADDRLLDAAVAVADLAGVTYTLVHVLAGQPLIPAVDPAFGPPPDEMAGVPATVDTNREHAAQRYLEWMAGPLRARGATVQARVLRGASVARLVLQVVDEVGADLVAAGTAAHAPVMRFFLGSTADKLVRSAPCSVLVSPPVPHPEEETRL